MSFFLFWGFFYFETFPKIAQPTPVALLSVLVSVFMYIFLSGLGLLVIVGLHQLLESRKVSRAAAGRDARVYAPLNV